MAKPTSHPGPVRKAYGYPEFKSYERIAQELIKNYPGAHSSNQARSLAAKIGDLDRGKRTWWVNHPESAAGLAALLQVSPEDLGLYEQESTNHMFALDAFMLPPLDLKQGRPWQLATAELDLSQRDPRALSIPTLGHWLQPSGWTQRPPYDLEWLYVEDDLEREILSRWLAAVGHFEVVYAETLADVASRLRIQKPVVICVRGDGGHDDMMALARRPENAGVLIIAPFMLPTRKATSSAEYFGWERYSTSQRDLNLFEIEMPGPYAPVKRWTWTLVPAWRDQLIEKVRTHIAHHSGDSLFCPQSITTWLKAFDPGDTWFSSTKDVLHLCQMCHHTGIKMSAASDADAVNDFATSLLRTETLSFGGELAQLAKLRWQRDDLEWKGALPLETWLALTASGSFILGNAENPQHLIASGLLKQERRGQFEFQYRAVANLAIRDYLIYRIKNEALDTWALACFDEQRRAMVDAALDALALVDLISVADKLHLVSQDSATKIGVSEAMFMAIARRIARRGTFGREYIPTLMSLAKCVLGRLDFTEGDWCLPNPWSRPSASREEQIEWIAACWSWSLLPEIRMDVSAEWLFPGWCDSLGEAPRWLDNLWPELKRKELPPAWTNFLSVVDEWVKDLSQPVLNPPRLLNIALLAKAARGAWNAESSWWQVLTDSAHESWVSENLLERISFNNPDGAATLWPSFLLFERTSADQFVRFSPVRRWLLEQLNPSNGLNSLTNQDLIYLAAIPETLPPAFRAPLLSLVMPLVSEMALSNEYQFLERFGPSAAPCLLNYLESGVMVDAAINFLWGWDPEVAIALLRKETPLHTTTLGAVVLACPANHLGVAIDLLTKNPAVLDASTRIGWARGHLSKSGIHSQQLIEIIANIPSAAS